MSDELKAAVESGLREVEKKLGEQALAYEKQIKERGEENIQLKASIEKLAKEREGLEARVLEIEQKGVRGRSEDGVTQSIGRQFVNSEEFKRMDGSNPRAGAVVEVKNTILSDANSVQPQQVQGVRGGAFVPLTIYNSLAHGPASSNSVEGIREAGFTNDAAEVSEGGLKPESELTFEPWDFPVRTIAHTLPVSKNLLADSGAVASYIDNRLMYGVMERVDRQLMVGNGTNPNLSGILDTGNYTVYTPETGDNLIDAINRAKWALWAAGWIPDNVYVNPGDWGDMELAKGSDGHYLNGLPGTLLTTNPFQVRVIPSPFVPAGQFAIGAFNRAVTVWDRQGVVVETGYVDDDFRRNKVTLRAEMRLALEITTPSAILGGTFTV